MSECVVRMEMPKCCSDCPCVNGEYGYCQADKEERQIEDPNGRPSWCPIIGELPEQHGDLIDRDKAIFEMCEGLAPNGYRAWAKRYLKSEKINPTIVPATERSET